MPCQSLTSFDLYVSIGEPWEDYIALFSDPDGSLERQLWSGDEQPADLSGWLPRAQARPTLSSSTVLSEMTAVYAGPVVLTAPALAGALSLAVAPLPCPIAAEYVLWFGNTPVQLAADGAKGESVLKILPLLSSLAANDSAPTGTVGLSLTAVQTAALAPVEGVWDLELHQGQTPFFGSPQARPGGRWRAGLPGVTR
jgi:hypothetical protein